MSNQNKHLLFHAATYFVLFNILPLFLSVEVMELVLVYGYTAVCFALAAVFVKTVGPKLIYFLVGPACFLPSMLILAPRFEVYAHDAYMYIGVIVMFNLFGFLIGWVVRKGGKINYKSDLQRLGGFRSR